MKTLLCGFSKFCCQVLSLASYYHNSHCTVQSKNEEESKWPLTGGVPSQLSLTEDNGVERIHIAGYQDGSVRIWDATYPLLSLMFVISSEVCTVLQIS